MAPEFSPPSASPGDRRERAHPIEVATRVQLVKLAFAGLSSGTIASTAAAAMFALVLSSSGATRTVWAWVAAMAAIGGYRLWLAAAFKRSDQTPEACSRWALRMVIATSATGLGWGATAWLFPTLLAGGAIGAVHVLMLAGITTGAVRMLLPMRKGSIAYLLAIMGPVCVRYFAEADLAGTAAGGCTLFFIFYMAHATLRNHRTFSEALVLRFERESLAAELTAENRRREAREAELREARERAESASRAKGEFLATISHEIRTPLNGVLGMLRVLKDTSLSSEQRAYVGTASDSAESLLLLLSDVLDFSKIEAGRLELDHTPFSPAVVINAVGDLMLSRARDKGLVLHVAIEPLPGAVLGDASRLRQILLNLVGNAIKFTERGRVELRASCREQTAAAVVLEFSVTDTGIGIDPAMLQRLFRPFTQVDASMSRRYGGTGLGLAISQRLAQAMGGSIEVDTAAGRGSAFRLRAKFELPAAIRQPVSPADASFVTPTLQGRVLVVEDDAVNQQVIELFLRKMNLAPEFAADGEAAIAAATQNPFDVVLMDCQLPGIDGLEATRRIREQTGGRAPRIVALTANANTHVRDACLAAGMDDFLSKPVRFEILAEVLGRHLAARRAAS